MAQQLVTPEIKRFDILVADLGENSIGSVQRGKRPVLVVQNDTGNRHSPNVTVVSITTKKKKKLPTHVDLKGVECGLFEDSTVLFETLHTISKSQIVRKLNSVPSDYYNDLNLAYRVQTGLL